MTLQLARQAAGRLGELIAHSIARWADQAAAKTEDDVGASGRERGRMGVEPTGEARHPAHRF